MAPGNGPRDNMSHPLIAVIRALLLAPFYFTLLTLFALWPWRFGSPFFLTRPLRLPDNARDASTLRLLALRLWFRDKRIVQKGRRRLVRSSRVKKWLLSPWVQTLPSCASFTRGEMERTGQAGISAGLSIFSDALIDSYRYANGTFHRDWFDHERRKDGAFHIPLEFHRRSCCYLLNHKLNPQMPIDQRHYDKGEFFRICQAHGLPSVPVYAVFDAGQVINQVSVPDESLFSKPADMAEGRGDVARWTRVAEPSVDDRLFAASDGERVTLDEIFEHLKTRSLDGPYLLQKQVSDHEAIRALSGAETLCALRVPTCRFPNGETNALPFALFKMPVDPDAVVNTGARGAVIYPVEVETGRLAAGIIRGRFEVFTVHPTSGKKALGFEIPLWSEALELCRTAHSEVFSTFPTIGWDVAITPDGPVLVEMNIQWLRPAGVPEEEFTGKTAYVDCVLSYMRRFWPEQLPAQTRFITDSD